jgi:hypothetical protein
VRFGLREHAFLAYRDLAVLVSVTLLYGIARADGIDPAQVLASIFLMHDVLA